jgi:phosphatidylinositol alpha-1,6-mannosyltransferase
VKNIPRVLLAAMSLQPGNGGIGRLARLTARVLARQARSGKIEARAITLLDETPVTDLDLPTWNAAGSRLRFVAQVQRAAFTHTHVIYDFLGTARAHHRVPLLRRPFLAWICGVEVWPEPAPDRLKRLRFKSARRADMLVSISGYTRARSRLGQANVCWLATESDQMPSPKRHAKPARVLMLSRVDETYKGHDILLDCWPRVIASVPDAVLTFAGDGPGLEALRRKAAQSACASRIEVLGFVPESKMDDLWRRTTVFAMPSSGEGFGLVYIEAMRYGIPVIATVCGAAQEINLDGVTGYNINLSDSDELPRRLIQLLKSPQLAAKTGHRGRERWKKHFRFSAFEARFVPILDEFLTHRKRKAA